MRHPGLREIVHEVDVCVVGGGMAGVCAALAAARHGANTLLMHDRPMLGGNASSEVRMWICGAHGKHNKETGILEEIQLENLYHNPARNYPVWDGVLYAKTRFQPNLNTLLNCSCLDAAMSGNTIVSVTGWQLTSQTYHTVHAKQFIDCSGDSILAPLTGAAHRRGRESADEFGEDILPPQADHRTMGNSLLIQLCRTDHPVAFIPPRWAYKFNDPSEFIHRMEGVNGTNFWWIEVGGINDTIHDAEWIRDELMKICYGVWDYIKNRAPEKENAANWALHWIGRLPGKRENRRYEGDHIMTQHDIASGGKFADTVAFGGWPMDDHHPAGMLYPGPPTLFHPAPSPYGIAYRCLYSRNIDNLLFAGRNISVTHAALSSTRVMGTCAVIGQAVGTAAAIAVARDTSPRGVYRNHLPSLQQTLMDDDCFLPGLVRELSPLAVDAELTGDGAFLDRLLDGHERDREGEPHAWEGQIDDAITFTWDKPVPVGMLRCVFDSNLNHTKRMSCTAPNDAATCAMPGTLVRAFRVEVCDADDKWSCAFEIADNIHRMVRVPIQREIKALRWTVQSTWGDKRVRVFTLEPCERHVAFAPGVPEGEAFVDVRNRQAEEDMAPPAKQGPVDDPSAHSA